MNVKGVLARLLPVLALTTASVQAADIPATTEANSGVVDAPSEDVSPASAAGPSPVVPDEAPKLRGQITPRLFVFDYDGESLAGKTHYLQRYDYQEDFSGDNTGGVYGDLDIRLNYGNLDRELFALERRGYGEHNHRTMGRYSDDAIVVRGSLSRYRSATGGVDYLLSPGQVPGGTVISDRVNEPYQVFNDDAGHLDYHVDRTNYSAGISLKPELLRGWGSVALDYQGYRRDGSKFAPFYLDATAVSLESDRWRGINLGIDERMNKVSFQVDAAPKDLFSANYKVSLEKFTNRRPDLTLLDGILTPPGVPNPVVPGSRQALEPFFYIPDTSLLTHAAQLSKQFGDRVLLAAGYSHSRLKDDSTPLRFTTLFDDGRIEQWDGEITTESAFFNANWNVSDKVGLEGSVKYHQRNNNSTFPVEGLLSPFPPGELTGPFIKNIDSVEYGLVANWRPKAMRSNLTLGWQRTNRQRDLIFGQVTGAYVLPAQTLFREDTHSDEVYLKWIARPGKGWTVRLTPSYVWADETGFVVEPERALMLKSLVSYASPKGWLASGFYDYKRKQNNNHTFSDAAAGAGAGGGGGGGAADPVATYAQDLESTLHAARLSLNLMPSDKVNTFVNFSWVQDDLSSYLFTTDTARWISPVEFTLVDRPNYKIDSYHFGIGADWQRTYKLKLSGSYSYSMSKGDVATGTVLTELQAATGTVDSRIDNALHSIALGAEYELRPNTMLRANYFYDRYEDDAYGVLSDRAHTFVISVSIGM